MKPIKQSVKEDLSIKIKEPLEDTYGVPLKNSLVYLYKICIHSLPFLVRCILSSDKKQENAVNKIALYYRNHVIYTIQDKLEDYHIIKKFNIKYSVIT